MALCATVGINVIRRSPEILSPPAPLASPVTEGVWKKRKGTRACVGAVCCSLERQESNTQQELNLVGEMGMEMQAENVEVKCNLCNGSGWLICDFCHGQKTNVKSDNSRFYRRCPNCRAAGFVLCPKCKVFKCVTFPDSSDDLA